MENDSLNIFHEILNQLPIYEEPKEAIESILKIINSVSNSKSTSLFLIDADTFEFTCHGTLNISEEEINKLFIDLVYNDVIAELLSAQKIIIKHASNNEKVILTPLILNGNACGIITSLTKEGLNSNQETLIMFLSNNLLLQLRHHNYFDKHLINIQAGSTETSTGSINKLFLGESNYIFNLLKEGVIIINKKTNLIIEANDTALTLLKTKKEELIGAAKNKYFLFMGRELFPDEIISGDETLLVASDGKVSPVLYSVKSVSLFGEEYEVISFLDITERKMMEDLILQSRFNLEQLVEERTKELSIANDELHNQINERIKKEQEYLTLYLAIQQSPAHVFLTDLDGNIEFANNAFLKETGYSFNEIVNQNPRILKSGDITPERYKQLWESVKAGKPWTGEFRNKKKNGELYWVSAQASPIFDSSGKIIKFLSIQEDISQRKKYEAELIDSKEKIEKAYNFKDALLSNMSHEFRTPLISIIGCSDLLLDDMAEGEMFDLIKAIQQGGNRLLKTLNNVLLLSDLECGRADFIIAPQNIIPLVKVMVDKYGYIAESKNLKIISNFDTDELVLMINEFFFNKALEYLIENAIKYTLEGSIMLSVKKTRIENIDYGLICVQDNGIGISEEDKKIIFDAFRQAEEGRKRNYEGSGLGLTIAQKAISYMGGFIKLKDNYPSGSTFEISLPLDNAQIRIENQIQKIFPNIS